jgi:hypothetical protein
MRIVILVAWFWELLCILHLQELGFFFFLIQQCNSNRQVKLNPNINKNSAFERSCKIVYCPAFHAVIVDLLDGLWEKTSFAAQNCSSITFFTLQSVYLVSSIPDPGSGKDCQCFGVEKKQASRVSDSFGSFFTICSVCLYLNLLHHRSRIMCDDAYVPMIVVTSRIHLHWRIWISGATQNAQVSQKGFWCKSTKRVILQIPIIFFSLCSLQVPPPVSPTSTNFPV